jgi:hypothetical protein
MTTDKQLTSSIRDTEWIDLSPGHMSLRTSIEEHIRGACIEKNDTSPIMVKGAFGIGKTATLHYAFHYAWTKLGVPAFLVHLEDVIVEVKKYLDENDLLELPNKDLGRLIGTILSNQIETLENTDPEEIEAGQLYFPAFDQGSLNQYLSKFQPAKLHTYVKEQFEDQEMPVFDHEIIKDALENNNRYLLLIDEFEAKYQSLMPLLAESGGGKLRQFFDDVTSCLSSDYYCIIGNGPASGYELNQNIKEKADVGAQQGRLTLLQINMATVSSLSKSFLNGFPKEYINFLWWLSRVRPRQIKKLKKELQDLKVLQEHNYIQFLKENQVLRELLDESVGDASVRYIKTGLFEKIPTELQNLIKELLINLGPYHIEAANEDLKSSLSEYKGLFYASAQTTSISAIIDALREDILKIRDESNKYSQINFDLLHGYIDLLLNSISNQEDEIVFGSINYGASELLSKTFLTPLFSILYDFITIYEDEHESRIRNVLDFILLLINKSENSGDSIDVMFKRSFSLFESRKIVLVDSSQLFLQLNMKTIRETIEQPIGSPILPYKSEPLEKLMPEVDTIDNIFVWRKRGKEEVIVIPNYSNEELLVSYIENLKKYFEENWNENNNYFGNGELVSNIIYLEDNQLVRDFKQWLCFDGDDEEIPYSLNRINVESIETYNIQNTQRISDFLSSLTKIATVGLSNDDLNIEALRIPSDSESDAIVRIDKIVDTILEASWTESKQTRRTIEYFKDLLLVGENSAFMMVIESGWNGYVKRIKEIVQNLDDIQRQLLSISIEDRIFENAHSVQSKNLFNYLLADLVEDDMNSLRQIISNSRKYKFRPAYNEKDSEVSLMDLFFSFDRNLNLSNCVQDYKNSPLSKYLTRFSEVVARDTDVNSLDDLMEILSQNSSPISSYGKVLKIYDSNIHFLNGFYYLALARKLEYVNELPNIRGELESIQSNLNELECELSDSLFELKELVNNDEEIAYNAEVRAYNRSIIQPLLDLINNTSHISYLVLAKIVCTYLDEAISRMQKFTKQVINIVDSLKSCESEIDDVQTEYDELYGKSSIHKNLISENKTKNYYYREKFVKSFKSDNSYNVIFGDKNKYKPSEKYQIDDTEFDTFMASINRSYEKKLPEIKDELEVVKEVDIEIQELSSLEDAINTLIDVSSE